MNNKLSYCREHQRQAIKRQIALFVCTLVCVLSSVAANAGDAPPWMHALVSAPLPEHDDKTDAVLMFSDRNVTVQSMDKIKIQVRKAYKILRPGGREYGIAAVSFNSHTKIAGLRGWCIPAQGKDYEIKDKEAFEMALPKIDGSELISDVKDKVLRIPAADPGSFIGVEYEEDLQPMVLQDVWDFQREIPSRETHYSLQLPAGWEYKASWINYSESQPSADGGNQWRWQVDNVKGIRREEQMPPIYGVAGQMVVSFFPPSGPAANGFRNWQEMGTWYLALTNGRRDPSPEIKQEAATLTASATTQLDKMRALAKFVQTDIRYVAIELGIGGYQPHSAADIFTHRYGDCKDKATLLSSLLSQIGVESYYVVINSERGSVSPQTPASVGSFNHAILAVRLPANLNDPSLIATMPHDRLGTILFFDPTNELTPFGQIGGYLQANYGLLVTPQGGELVALPRQPAAMNSIERKGTLTLDASGKLKGDIKETRIGDRASSERWRLRTVTKDTDRIKPIEELLAGSLSTFQITHATVANQTRTDLPFGFDYSFEAENYSKNAGNLLLVRPRVLGVKSSGLLETREPRKFPVEFEGPTRDTDTFEIAVPSGYEVDDLPPAIDSDYSFASYHSKTEFTKGVLRYTRTFEVKELSVPVDRADDLKHFYRIIAGDERSTAVLKAVEH